MCVCTHRVPGMWTYSWSSDRESFQTVSRQKKSHTFVVKLEKGFDFFFFIQKVVPVKVRTGKLTIYKIVYHSACEGRTVCRTATRLMLTQISYKLDCFFFFSCKLWFSNPCDLLTPVQMFWTKLLELILLCSENTGWFAVFIFFSC